MFTGITQSLSNVVSVKKSGMVLRVRIAKPAQWIIALGQSVAIDGVCTTIVAYGKTFFDVECMQETLAKTIVGDYVEGCVVNLERPLRLQDFVDGHLVQGHVDGVAKVADVQEFGETREIWFSLPKSVQGLVVPKGSVAINGVSLTVVHVKRKSFSVALIPFTLVHTNLGALRKGDVVNIEADLIARYVHQKSV